MTKREFWLIVGAGVLACGLLTALVFLILQQANISKLNHDKLIVTNEVLYMGMVGKKIPVSTSGQAPGQVLMLEVSDLSFGPEGTPDVISGYLWIDPYPGCNIDNRQAYLLNNGDITIKWICPGGTRVIQTFTKPGAPGLSSAIRIEAVVTK